MAAAAALRKASPATKPPLDAAGLQALAAEAVAAMPSSAADDDADRRGPFRPEKLVSARKRRSGALAVGLFRRADALALLALGAVVAEIAAPGPLLAAPLGAVLPFAVASLTACWALRSSDLYRFGRDEPLGRRFARLAGAVAAAAGVGAATGALTGAQSASGLLAWSGLALAALLSAHAWWWSTVRRWRRTGKLTPNVLVVGATRHAERLIQAALERRDVNILGVFDDRLARAPRSIGGVPVLGTTDALLEHRITPYVDRIVVAVDPSAKTRVRELMQRLKVLPNEVTLLVDADEEAGRDAALARLADSALDGGAGADDRRAFAKRVQDLLIGALALVLLSPLLAAIALAVRLDSPGPVFFRQRRHGFNNEAITVWKFRTMRHEAADAKAERQVTVNDERVTRIGRVLRKTSLDELPQLLNVLKGEMSLVGPRPHAIGMKTGEIESSRLVAEYAWRHRIKPGMTGWAAIKGSRGPLHTAAEVRRRVSLDVEYIDRQSFWLDLYVMVMTLPCLLGDREAAR